MSDLNARNTERTHPSESDNAGMEISDTAEEKTREQHHSLFGTSVQESDDTFDMNPTQSQAEITSRSLTLGDAPNRKEDVASNKGMPESQQLISSGDNGGDDLEVLRRQKIQLEQELFVANEQQSSLQSKLSKLNEVLESQKKELELLGKDRSQRMAVMRELEAERDQLMLAKNESEQKAELLLRQKEDYEARINRLTHDKNLLTVDVQSLKVQLEKLTQKNAVLEASMDEIRKDKRLFEYEKERWAQEKELYLHNKEWFMNEVRERDTKLSVLKIESLRLAGELQAEKASLSEECESLRTELSTTKSLVNQRDEQINDLNRRIREVLEDRSTKLNKLEEELLTSERLIGVYREASEEAERNLKELSSEYAERGQLLDEAKQEYQTLRVKLDEQREQYEDDIKRQENKIKQLNDELVKANELLKSKHRLSLTDEEVSELSPAAAAASALIKSGVSLTAIYREHCRVVAELEASKAEKSRLEEYINEFVEDLERKAPVLAQQRAEYERLNELCSALNQQLQSADEERQRLVSARDSASRELAYTKAELERTQRDNDDLAKQVRHLLHASEVNKAWSARDSDSPPISDEDRDILWASIGELQKVNQKLMSDLRSVKANHQQIIQEANQAEIKRLSEALDEAVKKLNLLKDQSGKQGSIIEQLQEQRDTYKRLAEEREPKDAGAVISKELGNARDLVKQLRSQVERSEKCLEIYREEKIKSDKILQDRIDQQFALISELRTTNGKLEADIEQQRQAQQSLTKQSESDATELELVRERLGKTESDKKTLEERLRNTEIQLFESRGEIGKLKSELGAVNEQVNCLRSSEARLHQELFIVRESNYSNEKMSATLQQLQSHLDRTEDDKLKKLEDQLNVMRNENQALKNFISEITEQHRIVSLDLKMTSNKIKTERDQALASKKSAEDRLTWKENEYAELQTKYDTLIRQLSSPEASLDTTAEGCRKEAQQLRNRNNYLENQLKDVRANLEAVEKKLSIREKEIEELTKLSGNIEATLVEQNSTNAAETQSLRSMLELVTQQLDDSSKTVSHLRLENSQLEQRCNEEVSKTEQVKMEGQRQIAEVEKRLSNTEAQRLNAEVRAEDALKQLSKAEGELEALQEDRKRIKEEIARLEEKSIKSENALNAAEASKMEKEMKIEEIQGSYQNEIAVLRMEKSKLQESLNDAREENALQCKKIETLNDNLVKLSQRNAYLERSNGGEEELVEPKSHSTNALTDIIKYLQSENEQSMERTLTAEVQWKRLQAQVSDLEESRSKLEQELKKFRAEAEAGVRALAEKSEMLSRLSLLESVQRENETLKNQVEKAMSREETMSKKISEMESQIRVLDIEKNNDKSRLQNLNADLQNYRKEAESWKERHAEAMTALSKIGPEKVVSLTEEIETLKRQIASMSVEMENGKRQAEESSTKHKSEMEKLTTTIHQLRVLAKNYKAKYLAVTAEKETLQKELSDFKTSTETPADKSESSNETESAEISSLKQQLLAARHEAEKLKQKLASAAPRTGWPVETMAGASSPAKGPSVLQAQMKQIESLNSLNKDLRNQLESLASRYKDNQDELNATRNTLKELQAEKDALQAEKEIKEEELRFRLNSITSMMTKKDAELARLRNENDNQKARLEELNEKIKTLEATLDGCRKKTETDSKSLSGSGTTTVLEPTGNIGTPLAIKPVSSSTSITSQCGSDASPNSVPGSQPFTERSEDILGVPTSEESVVSVGESAATHAHEVPSHAPLKRPGDSFEAVLMPPKQSSVSTTSEQSSSAASTTAKTGTATAGNTSAFTGAKSEVSPSPAKVPFGSFGGFLKIGKSVFASGSSTITRAQQSSTVSQSSGVIFSVASATSVQPNKPAQQNVISGSGDGMNVISSSGASIASDLSANFSSMPPTSSGFSSVLRKRPVPLTSDQSSSMESGSDLQETVKRQRVSPSEQVSTSSRFLQQNVDSRKQKDKNIAAEDDGADPEQQESVETTTNPEDEGVGEDYFEDEDRNAAKEQVNGKTGRRREPEVDINQREEEGEEEGYQEEMEGEAGDEEAPEDDEQVREEEYLDEALGEGGEEEYEDEMEEDEDYEDEEDYEGVEEEVPDIHSRRPMLIVPRSIHHQQQQPIDDEEVIVIEDDDEEDEVSHSQSPADQSTDEADEGPRASAYRPDTSNEPNGAERENDSEHTRDNAEGSDHLELQQPRRASETTRSMADLRNSEVGNGDSEVSSVPSGEMELSHADTTAHSAVGTESLTTAHPGVSRDSSPYVVNIESDSRGASSTVAPVAAVTEKESNVIGAPNVLQDEEGGNEVADEEQGSKPGSGNRTAQTDDEAGVSEPSTSGDSRQRRTRILYPDVDEPSSSSTDRARGVPQSVRGRGPWSYKTRRGQLRRRP